MLEQHAKTKKVTNNLKWLSPVSPIRKTNKEVRIEPTNKKGFLLPILDLNLSEIDPIIGDKTNAGNVATKMTIPINVPFSLWLLFCTTCGMMINPIAENFFFVNVRCFYINL